MKLEPLIAAAAQHGLLVRGGFAVEAGDRVPPLDGGAGEPVAAGYMVLFGNAGSAMWEVFRHSAEYQDARPHPLNRWSARIGHLLAGEFSAQALFPFGGPPHLPFLRWGKKAEALENSQLGMLIHPQFGLWHAYRFALAFAGECCGESTGEVQSPAADESICRSCAMKPCRPACPVNAFDDAGYDLRACFRYLESHPDCACMTGGCQARMACPEGAEYRYAPPHAAFHMGAFVRAMAHQQHLFARPHEVVLRES